MNGGGGVRVVRRADGNDVDLVTQLVQHFTEVVELLRVGEIRGLSWSACRRSTSHKTGDLNALLGDVAGVAAAFAADADASGRQSVLRRLLTEGARQALTADPETGTDGRRLLDKGTARGAAGDLLEVIQMLRTWIKRGIGAGSEPYNNS